MPKISSPVLKAKFWQSNQQIFYSIALLIIIPATVILNTVLFTNAFKQTIDQSLYTKAIGISQAINVGVIDKLQSPEDLKQFVNEYNKLLFSDQEDEIKSFDIFYPESDGEFKIIASLDPKLINSTTKRTIYLLSWSRDWPTAQLISEPTGQANQFKRYWLVVAPLKDVTGQKQALLSMQVSVGITDDLTKNVLVRSYWVLIATILIIVLLLLANSRLFEYTILYNKIKEVDAMKDEFLSMASHELKTPITVIQGYASLILEDKSGQLVVNDKARECLEMMNTSTLRLKALIEDLLNVSRIEQDRLKIELQPIDIWPIVEETVKELQLQANDKNLKLTAEKSQLLPPLMLDKDRFKQVLVNLIGNSVKYTLKGSVEVLAEVKNNETLILRIQDTGIGMSAKEREHLFEKFYRVTNDQTASISGTGLGLWITKQIVELMKGTILVDSIENVGTQVSLEFPITKK
ncbi:hypothetical protein COT94_00045 [Candidatus Falkowbacteria bacterium CG10_big_fil_rev_8_21_14_0_10_37_14]|uniref:histidine kinase n=1 Tax=Candidatus Falkowbacteria bacterium CG10_big_fil_rev_8_21_14_0_10_37_14 TaxID=1974561 RepID=A0A2M6WUY7_9BACT|nr:HAMP domain-containing histidine kinase [Candidatus Falkowbacteria bacterium]PIT96506.1 MAG: hypothetical protein COT94_00045 [Candidatus Falkowbacteria bacterium CG10_big_fil_rev_8_21_14_0_10_37_14]